MSLNTFNNTENAAAAAQLSSEQVLDYVKNQNGKVSAEVAQRYINIRLYSQPTAEAGIAALKADGDDLLVNLYTSIAQRKQPEDLRYLHMMNQELGIDAAYRKEVNAKLTEFVSADNLDALGEQWQKQYPTASPLKEIVAKVARHGGSSVPENVALAAFNFLAQSQIEHVTGIKDGVRVEFFKSHPSEQGHFTTDERGPVIRINTESSEFKRNGMAVLDTLGHEAKHGIQKADMVSRLHSGEIGKDHPHYGAARLYEAQFTNYVSSQAHRIDDVSKELNAGRISQEEAQQIAEYFAMTHHVYEGQGIEAGAREAGDIVAAGLANWVDGVEVSAPDQGPAVNIVGAQMGGRSTLANGNVAAQLADVERIQGVA